MANSRDESGEESVESIKIAQMLCSDILGAIVAYGFNLPILGLIFGLGGVVLELKVNCSRQLYNVALTTIVAVATQCGDVVLADI